MKRQLLTTILMVLLISFVSFAQFTLNPTRRGDNAGLWLNYTGTLDTAAGTYDSLLTNMFSLEDYDYTGTYFPFEYTFTSTTGAPNILVDLYGSMDNSTYILVEQLVDTTTSETETASATNLSNKRFKYYKLGFEQVASGRDNSTFDFWFGSPQKDPALKP